MILVVKYRSEWERLSCRKLPMDQYANCGTNVPNNVQSHKSFKVKKASVMDSSTRPSKILIKILNKILMIFLQLRVLLSQRNINTTKKFGFF